MDDLIVDVGRREVLRGTDALPISGLSFDLLLALIHAAPNAVAYDELIESVWAGAVVGTETVVQRAKLVRDALGDDARSPRYIAGVRGRGYRIVAPVTELTTDAQPMHVDATVNGSPNKKTKGRSLKWELVVVALVIAVVFVGSWLFDLSAKPHVTYRQVTLSRDAFAPYLSPLPIVTDGPRLYFSEWILPQAAPHHRPRQVSIKGGESIPLDSPFDPESTHVVMAAIHDRADLVIGTFNPFTSEGGSWLWAPAGGSPRRLDAPEAHDVAWSPGEANMVYANKNDVFVADGDGSNARKLLTVPGRPYWLRFSPDGESIRFTVHRGDYFSIWEVSVDGTGSHQFLEGWSDPSDECCGSWTPDGKYYVFQATRGGVMQIWAVRERQSAIFGPSEPFQLTTGPMEFARPSVSPDGKTVYAIGTLMRGEVMRYEPETKRFVPTFNERAAEWLSYSRDREWVAYIAYPDSDLWRSRSDGRDPVKLTPADMRPQAGFSWAPDNNTLAFGARTRARGVAVYLVDADGHDAPRRLTKGDRLEACPSWSPDGRSIAFATLDGIRIFDFESGTDSAMEGSEKMGCGLNWSPEGRRLAASNQQGIALFDFDTRRWEQLGGVEGPAYARWSSDGKYIFVAQGFPLLSTLRVRLEDGKVETTGSIKDEPWMFGINGAWVGMTSDGWPMYLRDERVQHIYALDWKD